MADRKKRNNLTTTQAAKILSVSPDTVLKWVKAGKIKSYRTLGGHFRIPSSELKLNPDGKAPTNTQSSEITRPTNYKYCWEYLADGGDIKKECRECITFRSRARRCYELKDLPEGLGCLNLMCNTDCDSCEYYQAVVDQGINVLIISENRSLIKDRKKLENTNGLHFRFVEDEYEAAFMIHEFRPDYIVVDCAYGKKRTGTICGHLFNDPRLPVVRVILASKSTKLNEYCDKEIFGWIRKPFIIDQLKECIKGVPASRFKD